MVGGWDDPVTIRFTSKPTMSDLIWNAADVVRNSVTGLALGAFITTTAGATLVLSGLAGLPSLATLPTLPLLLLGVSFMTGLFVAPFVWWSVRQRRDLALAPVEVEADDSGIALASSQASSRQDWSVYRRARETRRAFMLDTGTMAIILTKQGVDQADLERFRSLLQSKGLLATTVTLFGRIRRIVWIGVGVAVAAAMMLSPFALAQLSANVSLDIKPTVTGRTVHVEGTTDLPDGAVIVIRLTQLDEWERSLDTGSEDPMSWAHIDEVTVAGGRFELTAHVDDWPAGHALADAYFQVDGTQPQAVTDRFGRDGSGLNGPDVYDDTGYKSLVVEREFTLP